MFLPKDKSKDNKWLSGDWYGLRYLSRVYVEEKCQTFYDANTMCLAIPVNYRWPDFYERALVLASGKLPSLRKNWLYFEDISFSLAQELSLKLTASLVRESC